MSTSPGGSEARANGGALLTVVAALSALYALLSMCGGIACFSHAAFGPLILGVGGERPPEPPLELRWHQSLEAIFTFALSVMLLIASMGTLRRQRRAALMLGLWTVSAIVAHAIFLAWWFTIADAERVYRGQLEAAQRHALADNDLTPLPFGELDDAFRFTHGAGNLIQGISLAYPAFVGLVLLLPDSRRRITSWN